MIRLAKKIGLLLTLCLAAALLPLMPLTKCLAQGRVAGLDKDTLKNALGRVALILYDVRPPQIWAHNPDPNKDYHYQIRGATYKDAGQVASWGQGLPRDRYIVLYCDSPKEATSVRVAQTLLQLGYARVAILRGGFPEWERAGYPMEKVWHPRKAAQSGCFLPGDAVRIDPEFKNGTEHITPQPFCDINADLELSERGNKLSSLNVNIFKCKNHEESLQLIKNITLHDIFKRKPFKHPKLGELKIINKITQPDEVCAEITYSIVGVTFANGRIEDLIPGYPSGLSGNGTVYCHAIIYRDIYVIWYREWKKTYNVDLHRWPTILANAKKLIDLRFFTPTEGAPPSGDKEPGNLGSK